MRQSLSRCCCFLERRATFGRVCPPPQQQLRLLRRDNSSSSSSNNSENNDEIRSMEHARLGSSQWLVNRNLSPHISCTHNRNDDQCDTPLVKPDSLDVCFLGTGARHSHTSRSSSATAICFPQETLLFDAGEGAGLQLLLSQIPLNSVTKLFITHLHGDHIFGLPALLSRIQDAVENTSVRRQSIQIYGPVGLYNFLACNLSLCHVELKQLMVKVYELQGGTRKWVHPGTIKSFSEFRHGSLEREAIFPKQDGTWNLDTATKRRVPAQREPPPTERETEEKEDSGSRVGSSKRYGVSAAQVNHVPQMQSFGYMVQELLPSQSLNNSQSNNQIPKKSTFGFDIFHRSSDKKDALLSTTVLPHEFPPKGSPNKPRKVCVLGDCSGVPVPMAELCRDADLLIHEATLMESEASLFMETGHHSTSSMAGIFADFVKPRVLVLNKITQSNSTSLEKERELIQECRRVIKGFTQVQLSYDQMRIAIPPGGFVSSTIMGQEDPDSSSNE